MRQKRPGVEEDAVPAHGQDDGDAPLAQLVAQILDLADARADVVVLHGLLDADGHRLHVAARPCRRRCAALRRQRARLEACAAISSSFTARNPPMLASGSFFALMVQPSVWEHISFTISATVRCS
jgi:hypothetical protein